MYYLQRHADRILDQPSKVKQQAAVTLKALVNIMILLLWYHQGHNVPKYNYFSRLPCVSCC